MTTIQIDAADGPIEAHLVLPSTAKPAPAVVVIHDLTGFNSDLESILGRIADQGYLAIAPNLYSRGGAARCVTRVMRDVLTQRGRAIDDILAARDHVAGLPECDGTVAVAGFCLGGQFALVVSPKGFAASAPFYGVPLPRNLSETLDGSCPIVASFGKRDPLGVGAPAALTKVLERKRIPHDIKAYPGAGHSFANQLPAQPLLRIGGFGYNQAATEDAWRRVFGFFAEHMGSGTP